MTENPTVRVFVSAPPDVRPERLIVERVVKRLAREFSYHFRLEAVLWEREPLLATHHFRRWLGTWNDSSVGILPGRVVRPGFGRKTPLINRNPRPPSRRVYARRLSCAKLPERERRKDRNTTRHYPDFDPRPPPELADWIEWGQRVPSWFPDSAANLAVRSLLPQKDVPLRSNYFPVG
jgi:hypothetical protein